MARRRGAGLVAAVFRPRHDYLPGTDVFRSFDIDEVAQTLDLDAQARADGEANIPQSSARSLSTAERSILARLDERWEETVRDAKRAYEALRGQFHSYTSETEIDTVLAEPKAAALRLREIAREEADHIQAAYAKITARKAEMARFVRDERLDREPHDGHSTRKKVFILLLAVLAELIINISAFGEGDAQGWAGAATKAILIPILNIGFGLGLSFFMARRIQMRRLGDKLIGLTGWIVAIGWLIGLNLIVAHWRDAYDSVVTLDAGVEAVRAATTDPFNLRSALSWGLFFIGIGAGAAAVYEGWNWEDPYPGYSAHDRRLKAALADFHHMRGSAMARLQSEADQSANHLGDEQRRAELAISNRPHIAEMAASLADDLALYAAHLERVGADLFARYRQANSQARSTPAPAYFDDPAHIKIAMPRLAPLKPPAEARQISGILANAISEITEAHAQACAAIPSLSEMERA